MKKQIENMNQEVVVDDKEYQDGFIYKMSLIGGFTCGILLVEFVMFLANM